MTTFPVAAGQRLTTAVINHAYSLSDANVTTVTAAISGGSPATDLSSVYQIPASDAAVGMAYELACSGNGTTGSTSETMNFGLNLAGSIVGNAPAIGTTALGTSLAFRWWVLLRLTPVTVGSTATWMGSISGAVSYSGGNIIPGNASNFTVPFAGGNSAAVTQDSTVANDFSLQFGWGATTGSPTITCRGTTYTRKG